MGHVASKDYYTSVNRIAEQMDHHLKKLIYRRVFLFSCSMNHVLPYLSLSRADEDDFRDIEKHGFHSVLLHPFTLCCLMLTFCKIACHCSWASNQSCPCLELHSDESNGWIQYKMFHLPRLCGETADKYNTRSPFFNVIRQSTFLTPAPAPAPWCKWLCYFSAQLV